VQLTASNPKSLTVRMPIRFRIFGYASGVVGWHHWPADPEIRMETNYAVGRRQGMGKRQEAQKTPA